MPVHLPPAGYSEARGPWRARSKAHDHPIWAFRAALPRFAAFGVRLGRASPAGQVARLVTSIPSQMCWVNQPAVPMWALILLTPTAYPAGVHDTPSRDGSSAAAVDPPADLAAFMADAQVPWSVGAPGGAVTDPAWRAKPSWYLVATEDRMIPPPAQPAPFPDYQHKRQAIARPGKSASRTRMYSIRHHPASVRTQIRHFGRGATGHGSDQDAAHSGGYRATAATSDHHVARPTLQSVSEPSAEYARRGTADEM